MYVPLLANKTYHNLDEIGTQTRAATDIFDGGFHSIAYIQTRTAQKRNMHIHFNRGKTKNDRSFVDMTDSLEWAGPARWHDGNLRLMHGSPEFPPNRELMFYHRPEKNIDFPEEFREGMYADMIQYGYLLPSWVPLLSRYQCRKAGAAGWESAMTSVHGYRPFDKDCFGRTGNSKKQSPP
jgi:hypothetical protein